MYPIYRSPELLAIGDPIHQYPQRQHHHHQHHHSQPEPAMPVAPGGVQPFLDYDVESMAEFLALHLYGLCKVRGSASPAMRKFISQILHATRLPLATVLLSLVYLQHRVSLPVLGERWLSGLRHDSNSVYRVLTTMFVIANKFLDDNTFTNKSWSDVTHLDIKLITTLEIDWLRDVAFTLSPETIDGESKHAGWRKLWDEFVFRRFDLARQHAAAAAVASSIFPPIPVAAAPVQIAHGYPTPVTGPASPFVDGCTGSGWGREPVTPPDLWHDRQPHEAKQSAAAVYLALPPPPFMFPYGVHEAQSHPNHAYPHYTAIGGSSCVCSLCHARMRPIALGF